jgi:hypothetical protein
MVVYNGERMRWGLRRKRKKIWKKRLRKKRRNSRIT